MRYQSRLTNQAPVRSNAPQLYQSLASRLSAFSQQEENRLDQIMAKKAKEKGLIDAQGKTQITLRDGGTIADEAWNAGATVSHLAAIKNDYTANHARIYEENKNNPEAVKELISASSKGLIQGVPQNLRPAVEDQLASSALNYTFKAEQNMRTNQRNEQIATTNTSIDTLKSELMDALDSGDIEQATDLEFQLKEMIDVMALSDPALADDAIKMKADIDKSINRQMVIGEFKKAMDAGKDKDYLKNFQSKKLGKKFDPTEREKLVTEMLSMRKRRDNVMGVKKENFKSELRQALKAHAAGFDINAGDMAILKQKARDADMLDEFESGLNDVDQINHFSKADVDTRRAEIERLGGGGSVEDFNKWQGIKKADKAIREAAEKDGYALGVQQNIIEPTPLDITDPSTFLARKEQAQVLSKHYGVKVSAFTDQETTQFTRWINPPVGEDGATAKEAVLAATALDELDDPRLFANIAKKGAPVFATAAAMRDPQMAEIVLMGQKDLKLGNAKTPPRQDYIEDLNIMLGGVYSGENLQATTQSVLAYMAAKEPTGVYDSDLMQEAVTAVTGGIGSINGSMVELPRGVSETQLERFAESFTAETIEHLGGVDNRSNEDAAMMVRESIWQNKRDTDGYIVQGKFGTLYQNGEPLVIRYDPAIPRGKIRPRRGQGAR